MDSCSVTVSAGCNIDFETEDLSPLDCPTLRLPGDSSISVRMAHMSSVADITGKSTTSKQLSARKVWKGLDFLSGAVLEYRHSQKAGSARSSQRRFSNSSISRQMSGQKRTATCQVFQKPGSGVNMTFVLADKGANLWGQKHSYNGW